MPIFAYPPYDDLVLCAAEASDSLIVLLYLWRHCKEDYSIKVTKKDIDKLKISYFYFDLDIRTLEILGLLTFNKKGTTFHIKLKEPEYTRRCT